MARRLTIMAEKAFKAKVRSSRSHSSSRAGTRRSAPPALFTRTSRRSERADTAPNRSRQPCSVLRSARSSTASPPAAATAPAVRSASAAEEW